MSLVRIWVVAANGFREVIRDRILYLLGFFALLLLLALQIISRVSAGSDEKIFLDFGIGAISFLSALVAIFIGTSLINKEIEKRTLLVLIPKPLTKAEFILGKHLGLSGVIATLVVAMTLIYFLLLSLSQINYPLVTMGVCVLYLFLELILLIAVAIAFSVFTSSILATLLTFAVYLMGNVSGDLLELGKISNNQSVKLLTQGLYLILPDLSRFNLRNEAVYGLLPSSEQLLNNAAYGILYTSLLLLLAIGIFSQKEF